MNRSESIAQLAAALAAAQGQMTAAAKSADNPFYKSKYADLSAIWDVIRQPLSSNGLAVIQSVLEGGERVTVETMLVHTSGEWVSSALTMTPEKSDPQTLGKCITYARRYSLSPLVGAVSEEDDDGNAASGKTAPAVTERPVVIQGKPRPARVIPASPTPANAPVMNAAEVAPASPPDAHLVRELEQSVAAVAATKGIAPETGEYLDMSQRKRLYGHFRDMLSDPKLKRASDDLLKDWCRTKGLVGPDGKGTTSKIKKQYRVDGTVEDGFTRTLRALESYAMDLNAAEPDNVIRDMKGGA